MHKKDSDHARAEKKHPHRPLRKKFFDVAPPGKSIAPSNSRSVITGHTPPVPDDQFVASAPTLRAANPYEKHALLGAKHRKDIAPLSGTDDQTKNTPQSPVVHSVEQQTIASLNLQDTAASGPGSTSAAGRPITTNSPIEDTAPSQTSEKQINLVDAVPTETPAHMIMEQTVAADGNLPMWERLETSEAPSHASALVDKSQKTDKSIEELLAEAGPIELESDHQPSLIISHQHPKKNTSWHRRLLTIVLAVILLAIIFNLLLDAEIIPNEWVEPYTDWL